MKRLANQIAERAECLAKIDLLLDRTSETFFEARKRYARQILAALGRPSQDVLEIVAGRVGYLGQTDPSIRPLLPPAGESTG